MEITITIEKGIYNFQYSGNRVPPKKLYPTTHLTPRNIHYLMNRLHCPLNTKGGEKERQYPDYPTQ